LAANIGASDAGAIGISDNPVGIPFGPVLGRDFNLCGFQDLRGRKGRGQNQET
jgi:hypothetical protein